MKTKKQNLISGGIILTTTLVIGMVAAGCAGTSIKHLSSEEFLAQARTVNQLNSFAWITYIGVSHDRAYLEYGHPAFIGQGSATTVYWTALSELPTNLTVQLKCGNPPWTNWAGKSVKPR